MSATAQGPMNWQRTFNDLVLARIELEVDTLSAALLARGQHALEESGPLDADERLRGLSHRHLLDAALYPGAGRLRGQLEEAALALSEDWQLAEVAERSIAAVLNTRDQWLIKMRGLLAMGFQEVVGAMEEQMSGLDVFLRERPRLLEAVSSFKEEALSSSRLGSRSSWSQVPDAENVEPALDETGAWSEQLSHEDLVQVAMGLADRVLERRVALAIQAEPALRKRYDAILEDLELFESANVIPLGVRSLLRHGARPARHAQQRLAASPQNQARYEEPAAEDEIFVFADGSQLFAQERPGGWVLFLYRHQPAPEDSISGPGVEEAWGEGRLLCAEARAGEVRVLCNGQEQSFTLDLPQA